MLWTTAESSDTNWPTIPESVCYLVYLYHSCHRRVCGADSRWIWQRETQSSWLLQPRPHMDEAYYSTLESRSCVATLRDFHMQNTVSVIMQCACNVQMQRNILLVVHSLNWVEDMNYQWGTLHHNHCIIGPILAGRIVHCSLSCCSVTSLCWPLCSELVYTYFLTAGATECSFFCRMKCSRFKIANTVMKSPGYKVMDTQIYIGISLMQVINPVDGIP